MDAKDTEKPTPMIAPATLYEKIKVAYKANCDIVEKITNLKGEMNRVIVEVDPATHRVANIKKSKIEKDEILEVFKTFSLVNFPSTRTGPPFDLKESKEPKENAKKENKGGFMCIVEDNTTYWNMTQSCEKNFKGEHLDAWLETIHENICAIQSPLKEYYDDIQSFIFDANNAVGQTKSLFEQLGTAHLVTMIRPNLEGDPPEECISDKNCVCGRKANFVHFCCKEFYCSLCNCECCPDEVYTLLKTCSSICNSPVSRVCFECETRLCDSCHCKCK